MKILTWVVMLPTRQPEKYSKYRTCLCQNSCLLLKSVTFFTVSPLTPHQSIGIGCNAVIAGTNITLTCHINYIGSAQTSPELYACAWAQTGAETAAGLLKVLRLLTISPYRDEVWTWDSQTRDSHMWDVCTPIWGTSACSNRSERGNQAPKWPIYLMKAVQSSDFEQTFAIFSSVSGLLVTKPRNLGQLC